MSEQIEVVADKPDMLTTIEQNINRSLGISHTGALVRKVSEATSQIPSSINNLNSSRARELSGIFLEGLDKCGELVAMATGYEMEMQRISKKMHAEAFLIRAPQFGCKTSKDKEMYADNDDLYNAALSRYSQAKMFRILIENKREDLNKAHYLMRKVAEGDTLPPGDFNDRSAYPSSMSKSGSNVDDDMVTEAKRIPWKDLKR